MRQRDPGGLETQRRILEDAFFLKHDEALVNKHRAIAQMARSRQALSEVSGIKDDAILQRLVELGVQPATLASLAIAPLVMVAWADGRVDPREREAVLRGDDTSGTGHHGAGMALLEQWLAHRPGPDLMEAWSSYMAGLLQAMTPDERHRLRDDLLGRARAVAQATGSLLGLTSGISHQEARVLDMIARAFGD